MDATAASYAYDAASLRVKKTVGASATYYIFAGAQVIAEYAAPASPAAPAREYIYWGGNLVATIAGSTTTYQDGWPTQTEGAPR